MSLVPRSRSTWASWLLAQSTKLYRTQSTETRGGGERDGREGGNGGVDGNVVKWVAKKLDGELDRN